MRLIYDLFLALWVVFISLSAFRKKHRKIILYKLGLKSLEIPPKKRGAFRIWIHAVSLGETKASQTLIDEIKNDYKNAEIIISTTTQTGQTEAKKLSNLTFFLPIDFSSLMKRLVKKVDPDLFILVETDFWYNLLSELKKNQTKIILVNGKISSNSYNNFKKFKSFATALFDKIDLFCLQSDLDKSRFQDLGVPENKLSVTGNMKFDNKLDSKNIFQTTPGLKFPLEKKLVTIALTHENEEELILSEISHLDAFSFLLAPRHPERFLKIAKLLKKKNIPFRTITEEGRGEEKVILINKMGVMDECYTHSFAVIMGGSFISHVGGHNIYEAARHGIPVLYGPHMHKQESLVNSLKKHNIGTQISLSHLAQTLQNLLKASSSKHSMEILKTEVEGASKRSWNLINQILQKS